MYDNLPLDAVERVREIRNRHYEETKHMTREELREHNRKRYAEAKERMQSIAPAPDRFPFLTKN